jgi:hypothetical protein
MPYPRSHHSSVAAVIVTAMLIGGMTQASEDRIYQTGKFCVRFQTNGIHAIASEDRNQNGIPDQAEDILTQVMAAHLLFVDVLGFPDPFQTERFRSARFLDITIRSKSVLKCNGLAYDELQRSKNGDWIGMKVASSIHATSNLTPAHEFFHLIQYSTSYFKNNWFAEGTARWSESALGTGSLSPPKKLDTWPLSKEEAAALFRMSYDAADHFWNPLAYKLDASGVIPDSAALKRLQAMRYTDGSPVLKDLNLHGWKFIRDVIIELGSVDDDAFQKFGYDRWSEKNQFAPQNNAVILEAVENVVKRHEEAVRTLSEPLRKNEDAKKQDSQ